MKDLGTPKLLLALGTSVVIVSSFIAMRTAKPGVTRPGGLATLASFGPSLEVSSVDPTVVTPPCGPLLGVSSFYFDSGSQCSGNFFYTIDFPLLGTVVGINSREASKLFNVGRGWRILKDQFVQVVAGVPVLNYGTGNSIKFKSDGLGGFIVQDIRYGLTRLVASTGLWTASDQGGYTREFKASTKVPGVFLIRQMKDANSNTVSFERDSEERLTSLTDPFGRITKFSYDANGDLNSVTDSFGNSHSLSYDTNRDLISINFADGTTWEGRYLSGPSPTHLLGAVKEADGYRVYFQFYAGGIFKERRSALNYITQVAYSGTGINIATNFSRSTETIQFEKLVASQEGNRKTTITRDPVTGLATRVEDPLGSVTNYGYTMQGGYPLLTSETKSSGTTFRYTYNSQFLPIRIEEVFGSRVVWTNIVWNTQKFVTELDTLGIKTRFTRDGAGNVTQVTVGSATVFTGTYDSRGSLTRATDFNGITTNLTISYPSGGSGASLSVADSLGNSGSNRYSGPGTLNYATSNSGFTLNIDQDPFGIFKGITTLTSKFGPKVLTSRQDFTLGSDGLSRITGQFEKSITEVRYEDPEGRMNATQILQSNMLSGGMFDTMNVSSGSSTSIVQPAPFPPVE